MAEATYARKGMPGHHPAVRCVHTLYHESSRGRFGANATDTRRTEQVHESCLWSFETQLRAHSQEGFEKQYSEACEAIRVIVQAVALATPRAQYLLH